MAEHSAAVPERRLPIGTEVYVRYNVGGRVEYHGRLIVAHAYARRYVILTPDDNLYLEDYDSTNPDLLAVVEAGEDGWPPADIANAADTYVHDFPMFPPPATWARLTAEGATMAQRACHRAGVVAVDDGPAAGGAPRAPAAPHPQHDQVVALLAALNAVPAQANAGGAPAGPAGGVAALAQRLGIAVPPAAPGGTTAPAAAVVAPGPAARTELEAALNGPATPQGTTPATSTSASPGDARTMPVRFEEGRRYREYRDAVGQCSQVAFDDFVVKGPRTCLWVAKHMMESGGTPVGHHQRWRVNCKLQVHDSGVAEHETYCKVLQTMLTYDQLDVSNLAAAEVIARQIQLIEERYENKLVDVDKHGQNHLFSGLDETRGGICLSPALREYVAQELTKESLIMKERRKAREERALARKGEGNKS